MSEKNFNLSDWVNHPDILVTITKSPQEKAEDAKLRRFKDKWLFIVTQLMIIAVFIVCAVFTFLSFRTNSPYTGIALNGVIGIGLAIAGYYVRGRTN